MQVPPERELPDEVPFREVPHEEPEEYPDEWIFRSYPVGHVRDEDFWGWESLAAEAAFWKERARVKAARERLGGFGFRA